MIERLPTGDVIRDAVADDLGPIVAIYNSTIAGRESTADLEPVSVESRREWFTAHSPERPLWVVEEHREVRGWLSFENFYGRPAYAPTAEVSIYVAEGFRGRGAGRLLLATACARAPALGLANLVGFIFAHNRASLGLFEAQGFERWGHLPQVAVLDGVERDLVIVGRRLASAAV